MKRIFLLILILIVAGCINNKPETQENQTDTLLEEYYSDTIEEEPVVNTEEQKPEVIIAEKEEQPQQDNKKSEAENLMNEVKTKIREAKKQLVSNENTNPNETQSDQQNYDAGYDLYKQGVKDFDAKDYEKAIKRFSEAKEMLSLV